MTEGIFSLKGMLFDCALSLVLFLLVMLLYFSGIAWLVAPIVATSFILLLCQRIKKINSFVITNRNFSDTEIDNVFAKTLSLCFILFLIIPAFLPQLIFSFDWRGVIPFLDIMAEKMSYHYDDFYIDTGSTVYRSTLIGIIRIPVFYYDLRKTIDPPSQWFSINMSAFFSVNAALACISLISAFLLLLSKKINFPNTENSYFLSRRFLIIALIVIVIFAFILWHMLFGRVSDILSMNIGFIILNLMPIFLLLVANPKVTNK